MFSSISSLVKSHHHCHTVSQTNMLTLSNATTKQDDARHRRCLSWTNSTMKWAILGNWGIICAVHKHFHYFLSLNLNLKFQSANSFKVQIEMTCLHPILQEAQQTCHYCHAHIFWQARKLQSNNKWHRKNTFMFAEFLWRDWFYH